MALLSEAKAPLYSYARHQQTPTFSNTISVKKSHTPWTAQQPQENKKRQNVTIHTNNKKQHTKRFSKNEICSSFRNKENKREVDVQTFHLSRKMKSAFYLQFFSLPSAATIYEQCFLRTLSRP